MSNDTPTANPEAASRVKKSVALSGVIAGNSAVCTVGRTGNDLHYRGYDIVELALQSTFEEVAYLLVHGELPTQSALKDYRRKLKSLRGLPAQVKIVWSISRLAHLMDVLRTGSSMLAMCCRKRRRTSREQGTFTAWSLLRVHAALLGISARTESASRSRPTTIPWQGIFCIFTGKSRQRCRNALWTSP
jgi:citrate synthase